MKPNIRQIIILLVVWCTSNMPVQAASRVGVFVPHNGTLWGEFSGFAQASVQAAGLDLEIYSAGRSAERMLEQVRFDLNQNSGQTKSAVGLTPEERNWIRHHPFVRVGAVPDWAPFDMVDDKGEYIGVTRDFIDLITQKTGLQFVFKTDAWSRLLDGIGKGEYDLLGSVYYTVDRDRFLSYTQPYFEVLDYFFV
ncbi:MAG: transporter substrate-binding domain-containing protein, partial [Gammaproteobacteria bacterium]|nr:transporter substrate-binding domain-containing protein [Gammaproteobacteria bacterium]